jgi:hypothetical protein
MVAPSGPIPGENYTSDTRNYPWHRPPEFTDLDKAIDMIAKRMFSEEGRGAVVMLKAGIDVASITEMFLMSGVGAGKWTVDFALLLAGPVSHILCLMAEAYDIEYDLGIEDKTPKQTAAFLKEMRKDEEAKRLVLQQIPQVQEQAAEQVPEAPAPAAGGGMMGMGMAQQGGEV